MDAEHGEQESDRPPLSTHALRGDDCRPGWVVDAFGNVTRDENYLC